ncbi:MAG TPA: hypothetical protein VGD88_09075 [Opitutaceae bacterium]
MTSPRSEQPASTPPAETGAEGTGVPGFRTWRGVYTFVVLCFAGFVAMLAWLTGTFAP